MNAKIYIEQEIKQLVPASLGACLVTDKITVEGLPVRFMYREPTEEGMDSGWRFLSGTETDEYMENPHNSGIFDVNTVANYDRNIIPYLKAAVRTAWEYDEDKKKFIQVEYEDTEEGE